MGAKLLLLALFIAVGLGSITNNGKDTPISTLPSILPTAKCAAAPGPLFQGWKLPLPTTTWWIGLGIGDQASNLAGPFPYTSQGLAGGLMFGLPSKRSFDGTSIHSPYEQDLLVSFTELPANSNTSHKLVAFDELSVQVQWFAGAATMNSYLVQGSPYMTFKYNAATVSIAAQSSQVTSANGQPVTNKPVVTGTKIKFVLQDQSVWIIYSLSGSLSLTASSTGFISTSKYTGVIRIARLNATYTDTESLLDQYSPTYATSANISYSINGNTGVLSFNWNVGGGTPSQLLQLAWAHHRSVLVSATQAPHVVFLTVKGYQSGIVGNVWNMQYALSTISWFAPRARDTSCDPYLTLAIEYDASNAKVAVPDDFYFWGKTVQGMARIAVIAEEIGRKDLIPGVLSALQQSFDYWVNGTAPDPIAYETLWGGDVSAKGTQDVNIDYGNGFYNDHHFHYGYHLYAAAVIARYNPSWLAQNERYVNELARDIGNPSSLDPYYTITRMKDWFAGHSWASGIGYGGGERDEESSTEAINGYHGLYMWALASNNNDLADFARILLATEIHAVQYYWHLYPEPTWETPYPEQGLRDLTSIGNVQSVQAGAWTWWGGQRSEIASIQLLPYHPLSELIIDTPWATAMYNYTSVEIPDPAVGAGWKGYIFMAHSIFNNAAGFAQAQTLSSWDTGNSYTNTLWWIATRAKTSGAPTCSGNVTPVPYTQVAFQCKSNNMFITAPGLSLPLLANSATVVPSSVFILKWVPGGYNINSTTVKKWVTADNGGSSPLDPSRDTASSWETFNIQPVGNGYYSILAAANSLYVAVQSNQQLLANVNATATLPDNALFKIVNEASNSFKGKPSGKITIN